MKTSEIAKEVEFILRQQLHHRELVYELHFNNPKEGGIDTLSIKSAELNMKIILSLTELSLRGATREMIDNSCRAIYDKFK